MLYLFAQYIYFEYILIENICAFVQKFSMTHFVVLRSHMPSSKMIIVVVEWVKQTDSQSTNDCFSSFPRVPSLPVPFNSM
jgi:hypothetical protein